MNLALFDFDGTLSNKDSYLLFTRFLDPPKFYWGCLLLTPRILRYLAKTYPNHALKEDFLMHFYRGKTLSELQLRADAFCSQHIPTILRPGAIERIRWHQEQEHTVVIVSACPRIILEPWCTACMADIVATELETDAKMKITGRIAGKNCWGEEKVRRIKTRYTLADYEKIFAYGDSQGDLPMLELASETTRFFKPFR